MLILSIHPASSIPIPAHDREGPAANQLVINFIDDSYSKILALQNDEIDMIYDFVEVSHGYEIAQDENIEILESLSNGYVYLGFNCQKYPYNITGFRRALAYAMDKIQICDEVNPDFTQPLDSVIPAQNPFSIEDQLPYSYTSANLVFAQNLLDIFGFVDTDDDSFIENPDGSDLKITIRAPITSTTAQAIGAIFSSQLQDIDIDSEMVPTDFTYWFNQPSELLNYDTILFSSSFTDFDIDWLEYSFGSDYAYSFWNFQNFQNDTFDSWIDQLITSTTFDDVYEAATAMQSILAYECPIIPIYQPIKVSAYRNASIEGITNTALDGPISWWTNYRVHQTDSEEGGMFRLGIRHDFTTLNFMNKFSQMHEFLAEHLYDSLLKYDPNGLLIPWLAESYKIETHADNPSVPGGHTRFTFSIVRNATWSDGTPLTARDVAFTFNYYRDGENNPYGSGMRYGLFAAYAPTDYTAVIEFNTESYWHSSHFTVPILPKHVFQDTDPDEWKSWDPQARSSEWVTSGPFFVDEYVEGLFMELLNNQWYFRNPEMLISNHPQNNQILVNQEAESTTQSNNDLLEPNNLKDKYAQQQDRSSSFTLADHTNTLLTWTSTNQSTPILLTDQDTATGDHIVLNASYTGGEARNITMEISTGLYFEAAKSLIVPESSYDPFSGFIQPSQYSWMTINGIEEGDLVYIWANFTNGDSDFMAWYNDTEMADRTYTNNLLMSSMATGSKPEIGAFYAFRDGAVDIACFNYDMQEGNWTVRVTVGEDWVLENEGNSVTFDSYDIGKNETCTIRIHGFDVNNETFQDSYHNITLNNFFAPELELLNPVGGGIWNAQQNITWTASSKNTDYEFEHEVLISDDDGITFQLIASGLQLTSFNWDPTDWKYSDGYMIKVRTRDRGMVSEVTNDGFLIAGDEDLTDTIKPVILGEHFVHLRFNNTNRRIYWRVIDLNPASIQFFINGEEFQTTTWNQQRYRAVLDCGAFQLGSYNVRIIASDDFGNAQIHDTMVLITNENNSTIPLNPFEMLLLNPIAVGITLGSIGIIVYFSFRIVKYQRSEKVAS